MKFSAYSEAQYACVSFILSFLYVMFLGVIYFFSYRMAGIGSSLAQLFSMWGFVLICRRRSQQGAWLTETTLSENPQHQNMKVYRSQEYSSWGSSARTHHLHPPHLSFFSLSLIPLLHSLLFTRTFHLSLLRSCHPITLFSHFLSFSVIFLRGRIGEGVCFTLWMFVLIFPSFVYPVIQKSLLFLCCCLQEICV